ncbi:MAG TPA: AIR synthase-related protein, partial [Caulobacter sp.]|nr:AIR synthase-related protein [Caulobacter sp.]
AVSGPIGDGWLGLRAARGELADADLAMRYRLPEPRLDLRALLLDQARAAADISDGLLADAGHIARASGCGVSIDLGRLPLSAGAMAWLSGQPDSRAARLALATGGDDYQIVCALDPGRATPPQLTVVGVFGAGQGVTATFDGVAVPVGRLGWTHD